jgi:hypothetical protein
MNQFGWLLALGLGATFASTPGVTQTIPITARDAKQPSTVFSRPALVVDAFVIDKCLSEERNMDGRSYRPPLIRRSVNAGLTAVIRVNERLADHPDLSGHGFLLRMDGTNVDLAFGKNYILMIKVAPEEHPGMPQRSGLPPMYVPALSDVGFEDDGQRVHVLKRGGELSAYDGKPSEELRRAIERGR